MWRLAKRAAAEAADRQHRDVGREALADVGEPREVAAVAAQEQRSGRRRGRRTDRPRASSSSPCEVAQRDDLDAAQLEVGTGLQLDHAREPERRHPGRARPAGTTIVAAARQLAAASAGAGDRHGGARSERARRPSKSPGARPGSTARRTPPTQRPSIGSNAIVELGVAGEHGRVAAERHRELAGSVRLRLGACWAGRGGAEPARDPVTDEAAVARHGHGIGAACASSLAREVDTAEIDPNNDRVRAVQFLSRGSSVAGPWRSHASWCSPRSCCCRGSVAFGIWEPQERQLADRVAPRPSSRRSAWPRPRAEAAAGVAAGRLPTGSQPPDALARSLTNRAMAFGRDSIERQRCRPTFAVRAARPAHRARDRWASRCASRARGPGDRRAGAVVDAAARAAVAPAHDRDRHRARRGAMTLYGLVARRAQVAAGAGILECDRRGAVALAAGLAHRLCRRRCAARRSSVPLGALAGAPGALRRGASRATWPRDQCAGGRLASASRDRRAMAGETANLIRARSRHCSRSGSSPCSSIRSSRSSSRSPGSPRRSARCSARRSSPNGCWSSALGAIWRPDDDLRYIFDSTFEQIAYGTFPWGILAPIAMRRAARRSAIASAASIGALSLAWAGGAWIATEVFQRKVGFTLWAGFPALALAVGVWIDDPARRGARRRNACRRRACSIGLFVALAVDRSRQGSAVVHRARRRRSSSAPMQIAYPTHVAPAFLPTKLWILILGGIVGSGRSAGPRSVATDHVAGNPAAPRMRRASQIWHRGRVRGAPRCARRVLVVRLAARLATAPVVEGDVRRLLETARSPATSS